MSAKHTPGPWTVEYGWHKRADVPTITAPFGSSARGMIANLGHTPFEGSWDANARLLAAAPELLSALKVFVRAMQSGHDYQLMDAEELAIEVIRRVEGQP